MGAIMHRRTGFAAEHRRRLLGASVPQTIVALRQQVDRLARVVALDARRARGLLLGDDMHRVTFGPDGWIRVYSPDDSVSIQRDPNDAPHTLALKASAAGCTDAYNQVYHNAGATTDASGCDDRAVLGEDASGGVVRAETRGLEATTDETQITLVGDYTPDETFVAQGFVYMRGSGGSLIKLGAAPTVTPNPTASFTKGST